MHHKGRDRNALTEGLLRVVDFPKCFNYLNRSLLRNDDSLKYFKSPKHFPYRLAPWGCSFVPFVCQVNLPLGFYSKVETKQWKGHFWFCCLASTAWSIEIGSCRANQAVFQSYGFLHPNHWQTRSTFCSPKVTCWKKYHLWAAVHETIFLCTVYTTVQTTVISILKIGLSQNLLGENDQL